MQINYENKARVLRSGLVGIYKTISKSRFLAHHPEKEVHGQIYPPWACDAIEAQAIMKMPEDWDESRKVAHAEFERGRRLYHRIESLIVDRDAVFLTLTFSEDTMKKTCAYSRRLYVTRYLKQFGVPYVANIDFGAKNGREHYHAVLGVKKVDYKSWHEYGAIKGEKIRYESSTSLTVGKYIAKLTNHAIKATTRRCAIIYSR